MRREGMTRRSFLKTTGFSAMAASVPGVVRAAESAARRPNVLIIVTDDQGWGDIRSHGNDQIDTPVMDALAESGARFDRFYVSPVCAPTRASLLTGRYHLRTGVTGVTHRKEIMRSEEVTLAEVLRDAGYATGCFGKWHNGAHYPHHPNGQGFRDFFGFCAGHWNNYFNTALERNGEPVETRGYINDVVTDAALAFIEESKSGPFFCYVPYNTPHSPFQVPESYFSQFKARGLDDTLACVYGMCKNLDDNMGRLFAKLDALGLTNDTIVVFFGDNGPNTERYNGGMRGRKGSIHEGGVRNAGFMRWTGHIKPGTVVKQIAAHIDLLPTIAEQTGTPIPDGLELDGLSLVPLLEGRTEGWPDRMLFSCWGKRGAVRTQQYRLTIEKGKPQLFDMLVDPGQEKDVAGEHPDIAARLKAAYDAWYADVTRNGTEPPAIPVGYPQMPCVVLPAPECILEGSTAFKGEKGWANDWVTGWTSTDARVYWEIDVVEAATYKFTLMYTCPERDIGAKVCVEVGGRRVEGTITQAHDPAPIHGPDRVARKEVYEKTWAPLTLGSIALPKGPTRLCVRALTKPGEAVMDLKAVRVRRND
jgi:arylsulfatase A-like enzyme